MKRTLFVIAFLCAAPSYAITFRKAPVEKQEKQETPLTDAQRIEKLEKELATALAAKNVAKEAVENLVQEAKKLKEHYEDKLALIKETIAQRKETIKTLNTSINTQQNESTRQIAMLKTQLAQCEKRINNK